MKKTIMLCGLILSSTPAYPCSFSPGFDYFYPTPQRKKIIEKVQAPKLEVINIERGRSGDPGMCADAGIIEINVRNHAYPLGYRFEIVEGEFEDRVFPDKIISPINPSGVLRFVWLDGAIDYQEPINIKVKVVAISQFGTESEPSHIVIEHKGGVRQ